MSLLLRLWRLKCWLFLPLCSGIAGVFVYDVLVRPVYQATGTISFLPPPLSAPQESSETLMQRLAQVRELILSRAFLSKFIREFAPLAPVPACWAATASSWSLAACGLGTSAMASATEDKEVLASTAVERLRQAVRFRTADSSSFGLTYRDRDPEKAARVVHTLLGLMLEEDLKLRALEVERHAEFLSRQVQHLEAALYKQAQQRQAAMQALEKLRASYDTLFRDLEGLAKAEAAYTIAAQHYDVLAAHYRQMLGEHLDTTRDAEAIHRGDGRLRLESPSPPVRIVAMDVARFRCSVLLSVAAGALFFLTALGGSMLRRAR